MLSNERMSLQNICLRNLSIFWWLWIIKSRRCIYWGIQWQKNRIGSGNFWKSRCCLRCKS